MLVNICRCAALGILFALLPVTTAAQEKPEGSPVESAKTASEDSLMGEMASAFSDLEIGLKNGAPEAVINSALRIQAKESELILWLEENDLKYEPMGGAVIQGAARIAELASKGNLDAAGSATQTLQRSCLTCHLQHREDADSWRQNPGTGNTIWGKVELRDKFGELAASAANVVVFINRVEQVKPPIYPLAMPGVSQINQEFRPHVLPIVVGSSVGFPNDDKMFHNAFSRSKTKPFDLGVYGKGKTKRVKFTETGLVNVYCNIHVKMHCAILVLQNPHFAVTDSKGLYVIPNVPDGTYTLRTWHALGDEAAQEIRVSNDQSFRVDFALRNERSKARHRNKFGMPYKKKY